MNKFLFAALVTLAVLLAPSQATAGNDEQAIAFEVQAINEIAVSGGAALTVNAAIAGLEPTDAGDALSTYSFTTNEDNKKIVAKVSSVIDGCSLYVTLADPDGEGAAASAGEQLLSAVDVNVVTALSRQYASAKGITYRLHAPVAAGVLPSGSKTVTLTIVSE